MNNIKTNHSYLSLEYLNTQPISITLDKFHALHTAIRYTDLKPLSANITKWSNTLKQFVGNLTTNCLSVFDHFVGLALKGLRKSWL